PPNGGLSHNACVTLSCAPTNPCSTTPRIGRLTAWRIIGAGARPSYPPGWVMAAFEYRQAEELRDAFARHRVHYSFLGESAAILLGFPDTTQDVDVFPLRASENGQALVGALRDLGFTLTAEQAQEIVRGKDFVQLKNGPFDIDLVFAPDGIENFADA